MPVSVQGLQAKSAVELANEGHLVAEPRRLIRGSDSLVRYVGPTNALTGAVLGTASGATSALHLFYPDQKCQILKGVTRLGASTFASSTSIVVPNFNPVWISAGDIIHIQMDNGAMQESVVTSVVQTAGSYDTIGFSPGLTGYAAAAGNRVEIVSKGSTATSCAITTPYRELDIGQSIEIEPSSAIYYSFTVVSASVAQAKELDENGVSVDAPNQDRFLVLTLSGQLGLAFPAGSIIRSRAAASISMSQYGTAVSGADDWGWSGLIPDTQALRSDSTIEAVVRFNGGAGLADVRRIDIPVIG